MTLKAVPVWKRVTVALPNSWFTPKSTVPVSWKERTRPVWSTTRTVWPSRKCSSAAVALSTATWPGAPGRCPEATVKPRSAGSAATLMPMPGASPLRMTLPSRPIRGAWPTSRPAADLTPAAVLTRDSAEAGTDGASCAPGRYSPELCGPTAASTFLAPAAKLLK